TASIMNFGQPPRIAERQTVSGSTLARAVPPLDRRHGMEGVKHGRAGRIAGWLHESLASRITTHKAAALGFPSDAATGVGKLDIFRFLPSCTCRSPAGHVRRSL